MGQIYQGDLVESLVFGGEHPQVTIFWGDEDAAETTNLDASSNGWDNSIDLGTSLLDHSIILSNGLGSGKVFFYRILAQNAAGLSWSESSMFSTVILNLDLIRLLEEIYFFG